MNIIEIEDYNPNEVSYKQKLPEIEISTDETTKEETILDLLKSSQHFKEFLDTQENEVTCFKKENMESVVGEIKKEINEQVGKILDFIESKSNQHTSQIEETLISKMNENRKLEIELNILKSHICSNTNIINNHTIDTNDINNLVYVEPNQISDLIDFCNCKNKTLEDPSWTSFFWKDEFFKKEKEILQLQNENRELKLKIEDLNSKIIFLKNQNNQINTSESEFLKRKDYNNISLGLRNIYDKQKEGIKNFNHFARQNISNISSMSNTFLPITMCDQADELSTESSNFFVYD